MNIAEAIAASANATKRVPIPFRRRRTLKEPILDDDGAVLVKAGELDPNDSPPVVWFDLRVPDTMAMARAGSAALVGSPSVMPRPVMPGRLPPDAGLDLTVSAVIAAVVAMARDEGGEAEPVTLVRTSEEADPGAGRLYVGALPAVAFEALSAAVGARAEEGAAGLSSFLGG